MTLLQRDRENLELGTTLATKIVKLYHKGISNENIASSLQLDLERRQCSIWGAVVRWITFRTDRNRAETLNP